MTGSWQGPVPTQKLLTTTYLISGRQIRVVILRPSESFILFDAVFTGSGSGLVVSWEQETGILLASGDVRFIRVWDTQREMRMQVNTVLHLLYGRLVPNEKDNSDWCLEGPSTAKMDPSRVGFRVVVFRARLTRMDPGDAFIYFQSFRGTIVITVLYYIACLVQVNQRRCRCQITRAQFWREATGSCGGRVTSWRENSVATVRLRSRRSFKRLSNKIK